MTTPLISACIIARDEESVIKRCIDSVKKIAFEVIVLDTGSVDKTPIIAREAGAKVFTYEWKDDFGDARNTCMSYATGDYILTLDADEYLVGNPEGVFAELEQCPRIDIYFTKVTYPAPSPIDFPSPRMCSRGRGKWYGMIHEFLNPAILEGSTKMYLKSLVIEHLRGPKREVGTERNIRILTKAIEEEVKKNSDAILLSRYLFYMARELKDSHRLEEALSYFEKYLAMATWDAEKYRAYLDSAICYIDMNPQKLKDARRACLLAINEDQKPMEAYTTLAHISYLEHDWIQSYNWSKMALNCGPPGFMLFDSTSFNTFKAHDLMSIACWNLGKFAEGKEHIDYCFNIFPKDGRIAKNKEFFDSKLKEVAQNG